MASSARSGPLSITLHLQPKVLASRRSGPVVLFERTSGTRFFFFRQHTINHLNGTMSDSSGLLRLLPIHLVRDSLASHLESPRLVGSLLTREFHFGHPCWKSRNRYRYNHFPESMVQDCSFLEESGSARSPYQLRSKRHESSGGISKERSLHPPNPPGNAEKMLHETLHHADTIPSHEEVLISTTSPDSSKDCSQESVPPEPPPADISLHIKSPPPPDPTVRNLENYSRFFRRLALSLPQVHRPTRDDFLSVANGYWQRARVRFKWFTIKSFRKFNADDISAFVTWFLMSQTLWILIGTCVGNLFLASSDLNFVFNSTTFFSVVFATANSLRLQRKSYLSLVLVLRQLTMVHICRLSCTCNQQLSYL